MRKVIGKNGHNLCDVLLSCGICSSKRQARRLILEGAVKYVKNIDDQFIECEYIIAKPNKPPAQ